MTEKEFPYIYLDGGYEHTAIHRKLIAYDPRNTNNPIIQEYFNESNKNKDNSTIYYKLIERELDKYKNPSFPSSPISFQMVFHEINMAWVDLVHQMLFVEQAFETFYAEYKNVIEKILLYDTIDMKESLVYRYFFTGESIFHIGAKTWLFEKYMQKGDLLPSIRIYDLEKEMKFILNCYQKLENIMNSKFSIVYMTDFYDITLMEYLQVFLNNLKENKFV